MVWRRVFFMHQACRLRISLVSNPHTNRMLLKSTYINSENRQSTCYFSQKILSGLRLAPLPCSDMSDPPLLLHPTTAQVFMSCQPWVASLVSPDMYKKISVNNINDTFTTAGGSNASWHMNSLLRCLHPHYLVAATDLHALAFQWLLWDSPDILIHILAEKLLSSPLHLLSYTGESKVWSHGWIKLNRFNNLAFGWHKMTEWSQIVNPKSERVPFNSKIMNRLTAHTPHSSISGGGCSKW